MARYSYERVRDLIPAHIEQKYKEDVKSWTYPDEFYWDNSYDGNLFDATADYIIELKEQVKLLSNPESNC